MRYRALKLTYALVFSISVLLVLSAPGVQAGGSTKVQVCHLPPGNPENFHTITINVNALPAHLDHGDLLGPCSEHCEALCSDGNACTQDCDPDTEQCLSNHPPVNCDDSSLCTVDSCNPAIGCEYVTLDCTDGDVCDPSTGACAPPSACTPTSCPPGSECVPDGSDQGYHCE